MQKLIIEIFEFIGEIKKEKGRIISYEDALAEIGIFNLYQVLKTVTFIFFITKALDARSLKCYLQWFLF